MADQTVRDTSDRGSPEYVALLLLRGIAADEDKLSGDVAVANREWVLKTYEQCLTVTKGYTAQRALSDQ